MSARCSAQENRVSVDPAPAAVVEREHHLADHVGLELARRRRCRPARATRPGSRGGS